MSREIHDHKGGGVNDQLHVTANGFPSAGGAETNYTVRCPGNKIAVLNFHAGDLAEGTEGITNEALLAVVADRLRGFQTGPFACRESALALTHVETALLWLGKRTRERQTRGVEGKQEA